MRPGGRDIQPPPMPDWATRPESGNPYNTIGHQQVNSREGWSDWWTGQPKGNVFYRHGLDDIKRQILGRGTRGAVRGRNPRGKGLVDLGSEALARKIYQLDFEHYRANVSGSARDKARTLRNLTMHKRALGLIQKGAVPDRQSWFPDERSASLSRSSRGW